MIDTLILCSKKNIIPQHNLLRRSTLIRAGIGFGCGILFTQLSFAEPFNLNSYDLLKKMDSSFHLQLNEIKNKHNNRDYELQDIVNQMQMDLQVIDQFTLDDSNTADAQSALERIKTRVKYLSSTFNSLIRTMQSKDKELSSEEKSQLQSGIPEQLYYLRDDFKILETNLGKTDFMNFNMNNMVLIILTLSTLFILIAYLKIRRTTRLLQIENLEMSQKLKSQEEFYLDSIDFLKKVNESAEHSTNEIKNLENKVHHIIPDQQFESSTTELTELGNRLLSIIESQKSTVNAIIQNFSSENTQQNILSDLVHFVEDISSKSKVVHDIAFKTKVLSFNASVEAERAGARGRGFSIVAQEMKRLAEISGKAAEEIGSIVERTRKSSQLLANTEKNNTVDIKDSLNKAELNFNQMFEMTSQLNDRLRFVFEFQDSAKHNIQEVTQLIQQLSHTQEQLKTINDEVFNKQHQPWAS